MIPQSEVMTRVHQFLTLAQEMIDTYMEFQFPMLPKSTLIIAGGTKYLKIRERRMGGSFDKPELRWSSWCFIDLTNGDILRPATYKAPAKHARGNIFAADFGLSCVGPYGPNYIGQKPMCKEFCDELLKRKEQCKAP